MRLSKVFTTNQRVSDNIVATTENQLHKVDKLLFSYVNATRPDSNTLSIRVTEKEHEILQIALNKRIK